MMHFPSRLSGCLASQSSWDLVRLLLSFIAPCFLIIEDETKPFHQGDLIFLLILNVQDAEDPDKKSTLIKLYCKRYTEYLFCPFGPLELVLLSLPLLKNICFFIFLNSHIFLVENISICKEKQVSHNTS